MARLKLQSWELCIDDSLKSIELKAGNMKGYFYLAQAQLALGHPSEALTSALTAYDRCIETLDPNASAVSALVLRAKKEKWAAKEREKARRANALLRELEDAIVLTRENELQQTKAQKLGYSEEREILEEIKTDAERKLEELRSVFAIADPQHLPKRVSVSCNLYQ